MNISESRKEAMLMHHVHLSERRPRLALALTMLFAALIASAPALAQSTTAQIGQWGPVLNWGVQAKHMILLPTGKVLVWSTGENARVWDPATDNSFTPTPFSAGDLHCASQTLLPDGRVIVGGGQGLETHQGTHHTALFDPFTKTWTSGADMIKARWYATLLSLGDGRALITSGDDENKNRVLQPEIYDPVADTWTLLGGASLDGSLYPFMYQLPNGKIFQAGPNAQNYFLDITGSGAWTAGPRNSYSGPGYSMSSVMYRPGKILNAGGGDPAVNTATAINMNVASPSWQNVAPMNFARRRMDLEVMPDGKVIAVGGTCRGDDDTCAVMQAEIFNPDTGTWTVMDAMSEARMYHSSTVLLPDGRIVAAGGEGGERRLHAQIFSPPYLFKGARPTITSAPAATGYGSTFVVSSPNAADIASIAIIRGAGSTHSYDQSQRYIPLTFSVSGQNLTVNAPPDANTAAPGYYMLFLVNSAGVPAIAPFIRVAAGADLVPGSINGTVTNSSGVPIQGASVSFPGRSTTTNALGKYSFTGVAPGTPTVTVVAAGYATANQSVSVAGGQAAVANFTLQLAGRVTGHVDAVATGLSIAGVNIEYAGGSVNTDANGNYTITNIPAGLQTLKATAVAFEGQESTVTVIAGTTVTLNFHLDPGHTVIEGEVLSDALKPIAGATVSYSGGSAVTDFAGFYVLDDVPEGMHTITASAPGYVSQSTSAIAKTGFETTLDFALAPLQKIYFPNGDSKVNAGSTGKNYGTEVTLRTRTGWDSYVQFDVAGLSVPPVSAILRLYPTDATKNGVVLYALTQPFNEKTITYANAPACGGTPLASKASTKVGQWVELDVTSAIGTSGVYGFCLKTVGTDSGFYSSREGANPPELVIVPNTGPGGCTLDAQCSDGIFCNGIESCNAGTCVAGAAVDCNDGVSCTSDSCDIASDQCLHATNDGLCSDGLFCDGTEFCDATAGCQESPTSQCSGGSCDEAFDVCTGVGASPVVAEIRTGVGTAVTSIQTATTLAAANGDLYIATVATKPKINVTGVLGLGLPWREAVVQCAGRSATGLAVWVAQGTPTGAGAVSASLATSASAAAIAVSHYSNVSSAALGNIVSGNSKGVAGACSGGIDQNAWNLSLPIDNAGATAFVAVARRGTTHTAVGFNVLSNISAGSGGSTAGLVIGDQTFNTAQLAALSGTFSSAVDWAALAIEIVPAAGPGPGGIADLPPVPVPAENPITEQKRILGKILFWDEQLSNDDTVACGTCHMPRAGGADPRLGLHPGPDLIFGNDDDVVGSPGVALANSNNQPISHPNFGFGPQVTRRAAPVFIGSQYSQELFVDGAAGSRFLDPVSGVQRIASGGALENQSVRPPLGVVEMAHQGRDWAAVVTKLNTAVPLGLATNLPADVAARLASSPSYPDLFRDAFGTATVSADRIAFALASYERTLVPDQTPWDAFMAGDSSAMTASQQAGWDAFKVSLCASCHTPPLFTDNQFHNIGVRPPAEDTGRQEVTGLPVDRGKFRTPTLRNAALKSSFMHNGKLTSMGQAIDFYLNDRGKQFLDNLDPLMPQVAIPEEAQLPLLDFLENGLIDPRVEHEQFPFDRPTLSAGGN